MGGKQEPAVVELHTQLGERYALPTQDPSAPPVHHAPTYNYQTIGRRLPTNPDQAQRASHVGWRLWIPVSRVITKCSKVDDFDANPNHSPSYFHCYRNVKEGSPKIKARKGRFERKDDVKNKIANTGGNKHTER